MGTFAAPLERRRTRARPGAGPLRARSPSVAESPRRIARHHSRSRHSGHRRSGADSMTGQVLEPVISLSEIAEIELVMLKRLKERTVGDHTSVAKGPGHDF